MNRLTKRSIWMMVTFVLVVMLFFVQGVDVRAAEIIALGTCGAQGDNVTWT